MAVLKRRSVPLISQSGPRYHFDLWLRHSWWLLDEAFEVWEKFYLYVMPMLRTLSALVVTFFLLPPLLALACFTYLTRKLRISLLRWANPRIELAHAESLRGALDSKRNPALVTLLITLDGALDHQAVRQRIREELIDARNPDGTLKNPCLRKLLRRQLGLYIWEDAPEYNIDKHVTVATQTGQGKSRIVTNDSLQVFVSELCAKPLPRNCPPWQIVLIPGIEKDSRVFYVLLRIHHMLSDLIALKDIVKGTIPDPYSSSAGKVHLLNKPTATRELAGVILDTFYSSIMWIWRSFKSYAEESAIVRIIERTAMGLWSIAVMAMIEIKNNKESENPFLKLVYLSTCAWGVLYTELLLNCNALIDDLKSFAMFLLSFRLFGFLISLLVKLLMYTGVAILSLPLFLLKQYKAYREGTHHTWSLVKQSAHEMFSLISAFVIGPRLLFEIFLRKADSNHLQRVSLYGRKTVGWSHCVDLDLVQKIRQCTNSSVSEVLLAAATRVLQGYFKTFGEQVPESIHASIPAYTKGLQDVHESSPSGYITVSLPTGEKDDRLALKKIREELADVKSYPIRYLASVWILQNIAKYLPRLVVQILANHLTRKYPIMLTNLIFPTDKVTLWGHDVKDLLYFRSPQANIGLSLNMVSFNGRVRLGVMVDQALIPHHSAMTSCFPHEMSGLASNLGIRRERFSPRLSPPVSPSSRRSSKFMFPEASAGAVC